MYHSGGERVAELKISQKLNRKLFKSVHESYKRIKQYTKMQRNKAKDNEVQAIIRVARWSVVCVIVMWASTFLLLLLPEGNQGTYGDMFGAVNALFSGLAFAGLIITLILQRKELSLQREDIFVERNEAKFYKMLDIYSGMTRGLEVHGVKGKAAFAELVGEFSYTYNLINQIFRTVLCEQPYLLKANNNLKNIILELKSDRDKRDAFLTDLAYNLFFYGSHYMVVDFDHPERTALGEAIKDIAFKENRKGENNTFADYVKDGVYEVKLPNKGLCSKLFEGHSDFLGHYFRHLFQMVKYVASLNDELFDENTKAGYVKMLRSQMSDYEQILLYYNSLTEQGAAWNKSHGERFPEDASYIVRFRMIKNIPPNFPMFGVLAVEKYKEDANRWEKLGKKFYEHKFLPISKGVLDYK